MFCALLLASPAMAQMSTAPLDCGAGPGGATDCASAGPASPGNTSGTELGAGNPINVVTGNKYQRETDLPALPGPLGLEIVRHYNSSIRGLGQIGYGWRLSYETDLYAIGDTVQILTADGRRLIFQRTPQEPAECAGSNPADGRIAIRRSADGREHYRWIWPGGRELDFNPDGRLVSIAEPNGPLLTLTRGPRGELLQVSDPQGRSLLMHYGPAQGDGFKGIVAIDSPVGRFEYVHETEGAGISNLLQVRYPNGLGARHYHYETERQAGHPHALTGISQEMLDGERTRLQRLSTWGYDEQGRAVVSVRGEPRRLDADGQPVAGTGVEQVELSFVRPSLPDGEPGETVLTNSLGQLTRYRHAQIGGQYRLLEARGAGCAGCGETDVRYGYDRHGSLVEQTKLDRNGQPLWSLHWEYDSLGRIVRHSRQDWQAGRVLATRLLERREYEGPRDAPSLVARPSVVPGREHQLRIDYNERGQPLRVHETGYSPLTTAGDVAANADQATRIDRSTTYAYRTILGRSLLAEIDGPLPNGPKNGPEDSDITRYEWDARGNFIVVLEQAGGRRTALQYHPDTGLPQRVVNDEGVEATFAYNLRAQLVSVRSHGPGGSPPREQQIRHDALGRPVEGEHPGVPGANWRQAWDEHGRLQWRASALGVLNTYAYDTEGRLIEQGRHSASFEQTLRRRYDESGRLAHVRDNAGRSLQWHYDAQGRLERMVDALGFGYPAPADPTARPAETDPAGRILALRDDFGRTVLTQSPDSGTVLRQFDAANRLVAMRDAGGNHARYDYDAQGRILRQTVTDARSGNDEVTVWRYSGRHLVELVHPTQSERYEYDARGYRRARIVRLPTEQGELTAVTRYEHDEAGRLVATTLPDGSRLRYQRNGQGQVVALTRNPVRTAWLRWLGREQTIARGFERDLIGLRGYTTGNGIETHYQRSRNGALARVVHRHRKVEQAQMARHGSAPLRLGYGPQEAAERLLGIAPARAQTPPASKASRLPGALGLPNDPSALIDHRYLWDVRGNLLHSRQLAADAQPAWRSHAYDGHDRLLASVEWQVHGNTLAEQGVWRYAYDRSQRRVLDQQGVASQAELYAGTRRSAFVPDSHRRIDGPASRYSASGQPEQLGHREYHWDARGRLVEAREHGTTLVRYSYDHRGLRNRKTLLSSPPVRPEPAEGRTIHYLYDDARQPLAELDGAGRILRQYVWLADLPLAVLDTPEGSAPASAGQGAAERIVGDLRRIAQSWLAGLDGIAWLHANHLGAPELATGAQGQVLWRAHYAPFGAASVTGRESFALHLRLPGQYFDPETGLHYNRARYYDPQAGQYLSPDPLGTPDGPNPYAYVAFNPLRYIDPDGLILFAFDGTDNSRDRRELERLGGSRTNVVRFADLYEVGGAVNYVSGVGTRHFEDGNTNYLGDEYQDILPNGLGPIPDRGGNFTGRARIERMWSYFIDAAEAHPDDETMDIDIVGFSRGAAQAREFANRLVAASVIYDGVRYIRYSALDGVTRQEVTRCQPVNLRFMGLFDTVLSTDLPWGATYRLAIPAEFAHVVHAVALNEYRSQPYSSDVFGYPFNAAFWNATRRNLPDDLHQGGFPLESIGASSHELGQVRIERGFIGAHADIGGGYDEGENQLSFVALNWMVEQAQKAGVNMNASGLDSIPVSNPILHDQSNALRIGDPRETPPVSRAVQQGDMTFIETELLRAEDREVRGAVAGTTQRDMGFTDFGPDDRSLTTGETHDFIAYTERPVTGNPNDTWDALTGNQTGRVNIAAYMDWLCEHGYFERGSAQCASGGAP
ncbi:RHS repeat-associated core domain-containing protein [Thauera sedimentorum]|uniref:RHS repeat-associated core domain-containing protein n=1 Tax=Thauera sedimentorum TaxID=2767595 RepID=UPI0032E7FCB7